MKKTIFSFLSFFVFLFEPVYAHCPLCTGAMVAGVAATRYLGVSDSIVGIFAGGLIISMALWFNRSKLKKKYIPISNFLSTSLIWIATVFSFQLTGLLESTETILGMGSLLFGIILGSIVSYLGFFLSKYIKKLRSGKVLFPFQTIAITLVFLILASLIIFWVI